MAAAEVQEVFVGGVGGLAMRRKVTFEQALQMGRARVSRCSESHLELRHGAIAKLGKVWGVHNGRVPRLTG